jgi:YgiT-type zinc finger domain-containing protein
MCGGQLVLKQVEHEVSVGPHQKVIKVPAFVCRKCGERVYTEEADETIKKLEEEMGSIDQEF